MNIQLEDVPLEWLSMVNNSYAEIEGVLQADLQFPDTESTRAYGSGTVDTVFAKIPSLGTSFGGHGNVLIRPNKSTGEFGFG